MHCVSSSASIAGPVFGKLLPQGFSGVDLAPGNRLLAVGGASLLVNLETGNWLRLSPRGERLWRCLSRAESDGDAGLLAELPQAELDAFLDTLAEGRFARVEGRGPRRLEDAAAPRIGGCRGAACGGTDPLRNVMLNVTYLCNLRCEHCAVYTELGTGQAQRHVAFGAAATPGGTARESTREMLDLLDTIARQGVQSLVFFGGEPLLRRDFGQIIEYAAERIPRLGLATNGTLLGEEICRTIARHVAEVKVSLDGACPEVHDSIRGHGAFQKTVEGIRRLRRLGCRKLVVKAVINRRNAHDVPNLVRLSRQLDVELELGDFAALGRGEITRHEWTVGARSHLETYQAVWLLAEYYGAPEVSFNSYCSTFMRRAGSSCEAGCDYVLIDSNGEIYPCEGLQHGPLRLGSMRDELVQLRPLAAAFDASVDNLPMCSTCEVRYFCRGGCAAEAYARPERKGSACSQCGLYRMVLPHIVARWDPRLSSWRNLKAVFGDDIDFSQVERYLNQELSHAC